jgi:hypothetical protein
MWVDGKSHSPMTFNLAMKSKVLFTEANSEILRKSATFFSQIGEYGHNNIIANYEHLIWKHLENPHGKSLISTIELNNDIKAVMIFQKNYYYSSGKEIKYFLATDMAFIKDERKLSKILDYWKECIQFIKKEYPDFIIIHSSNIKSEPIYGRFFKEFRIGTIKAKIYLPGTKKMQPTVLEDKKIEYTFDEWRWSPRSQVKYKIYRNSSTKEPEIIYRVQKKFGLRVIIIVEINPNILIKETPKTFWKLLILCLKEGCLLPIFYLDIQNGSLLKHISNFIEVPKIISSYEFPIYVHNDSEKIVIQKDILQLSMLDVM